MRVRALKTMATPLPTAAPRARRLWMLTAAAVVAVLAVVVVVHGGRASDEQQIGKQVYGEDCLTKVSANGRVARRWPQAAKAEVIVCETSESDAFANDVLDSARFDSAAALAASLRTAPPDGRYCTLASAVVTAGDDLDRFTAMC